MSTTSLKGFLEEKTAARAGASAPRVHLAAFGKHPGWNDHIDDLGFETQSLVVAKRFVYLEGIASQIDTGAWDRLEPAARFASFDHWLLWQRGAETLCAVLVDSRDGKGRTRYPMVLCLHAIDVPLHRVTGEFAPVLARAIRDCMAVATAEEVVALLDAARAELRRQLAETPVPPPPPVSLVEAPALGPANEGLFRLLYQIKNQFSAWARGCVDYDDDEALPRPATLRAPQAAADFAQGAAAWMNVFRAQLGDEPPILFLWPRSAPWFDIVVGAPDAAAFFALKAGAGAIPLATEVPYQFDDAFRTEALAAAAEFPQGAAARKTIFGAELLPARKRTLPSLQLGRARRAVAEGGQSVSGWWSSWSPKIVRALLAVFLLLALGIAGLIYWATRSVKADASGADSAPTGAARNIDAATLAAWRELCTASYDWFGRLNGELRDPARRARWKQDPELRSRVIEKIEAHETRLQGFSPQRLANTSGAVQALIATPPPSLSRAEVAQSVRQAAGLVADIGRALREWAYLGRLDDLNRKLAARGWNGTRPELEAWRAGVQLDANLARTLDDLLARQADVRTIEQKLAETDAWTEFPALNDPFLHAWTETAAAQAGAARSVAELSDALARGTRGLADVVALLRDPGLDRVRLAQEPPLRFDPSGESAAQVARWVERARGCVALPAGERPLPEAAWQSDLAQLRRHYGALQQLARGENLSEFASAIGDLERRYAAFRAQPALRRDLPRLRDTAGQLESDRGALARKLELEVNRRTDPAAWIALLRESKIEGAAPASAEWQKRREALIAAAHPPPGGEGLIALQRAAARAEEFLRAAARAPELPTQIARAPDFSPVVQRRRDAALETLLRLVSWRDGQPEKSWGEFIATPAAQKVVADYTRDFTELSRFAEWLDRNARHLAQCAPWDRRPPADRETPAADSDVLGLPRVEELARRLAALRETAGSSDRARLAHAAALPDLAVAFEAWRALGRLGDWPRGAAEIATEQKVREHLGARTAQFTDSTVRDPLAAELKGEARRRWSVAAGQVRANDDWRELLAAARASDIDITALPPRERYNEWLWRVKQTPWRTLATDEFAARRGAFLAELQRLPEPARIAEPWLAELEKISTQEVSIDLSKVGPGAAGWKLAESPEADMLSFTWAAPGAKAPLRLDFRQLDGAFERPVYLAVAELPVGVFLDWCEARNLWTDLLAQMSAFVEDARANPNQEIRRGPRVFHFVARTNKLALAPNWVTRSGYYPAGAAPAPPDAASPVNYLPPGAAEFFARSLSCRLPTVAEWQSAWRTVQDRTLGAAPPTPLPNRRDATWQKQADFVAAQEPGKEKIWPDADAFYPPTVFPIMGMTKPAAVKDDDGTLWFRAVTQDAPAKFLNLAGNVAEFALDPAKTPAARMVIGGSALSVAEIETATPYPVQANGYSDVGLRLAFTIDRLTPGQRAAQIVHDAAYRN